jgi:hypothetical protein
MWSAAASSRVCCAHATRVTNEPSARARHRAEQARAWQQPRHARLRGASDAHDHNVFVRVQGGAHREKGLGGDIAERVAALENRNIALEREISSLRVSSGAGKV